MQTNRNGATAVAYFPFNLSPSLDGALQALALWEEDRLRFSVGNVFLSFDGRYWLVLVSEDLMRLAIPF